jgi:hypothetical protein
MVGKPDRVQERITTPLKVTLRSPLVLEDPLLLSDMQIAVCAILSLSDVRASLVHQSLLLFLSQPPKVVLRLKNGL